MTNNMQFYSRPPQQGEPFQKNKYDDPTNRMLPSHWIAQVTLFDTKASMLLNTITDLRRQEPDSEPNRARFRRNVELVGSILAYEHSRRLGYDRKEIITGNNEPAIGHEIEKRPVILGIARAGVPMARGAAGVLYGSRHKIYIADASRLEGTLDQETGEMKVLLGKENCPSLEGEDLTVWDPMLATGSSAVQVISQFKQKHGKPRSLDVFCVLAAPKGVERMLDCHPGVHVYIGALDERLNDKGYIVPGLGDAGDRMYGPKHPK